MPHILHPSPIIQESLEHGLQVSRIARDIFRGMASLHGLDDTWSDILVIAARLHDLGWIYGKTAHHKASAKFILAKNSSVLPELLWQVMEDVFTHESSAHAFHNEHIRTLVALVARYHRRAEPSPKHKLFAALSPQEQKAIQQLAALIRIADALDFTHTSCVQGVNVFVERECIRLKVDCQTACDDEIYRIQHKKELFRKVFSRDVLCQQIQ